MRSFMVTLHLHLAHGLQCADMHLPAQLFRELLLAEGFLEIHSPKLIAGASEGGSAVFKLDYMGQGACLAQSPQIHKQMALAADMRRVFEIGPVFRCALLAVQGLMHTILLSRMCFKACFTRCLLLATAKAA